MSLYFKMFDSLNSAAMIYDVLNHAEFSIQVVAFS